jgi:uncharacterized protein YdeI (YjbR/CyaY-like superfamily)
MKKDPLGGLPIKSFIGPEKWEAWLAKNHAKPQGIWLRMFKKSSGKKSVNYAEALDVALCYGWIDGQVRSHDAESWIQKFTPRRAHSIWSKVNTKNIQRLMKAGRMKPAGLAQVKAAKADGRWAKAYHSPSTAVIPKDFLKLLNKNKRAKAFFATLTKRNTYPISYLLGSAKKPETRERRMKKILGMLARGQKFH